MFDGRQIFIITPLIVQLVISSVKIVASIVVLGLGLSVSAYAADDSSRPHLPCQAESRFS
jgi:hypothetical protein